MAGTFEAPEIVQEELDILLIGGGMACCGTAYEMMRWAEAVKAETGTELKIKLVDKAAMDRSGARRDSGRYTLEMMTTLAPAATARSADSVRMISPSRKKRSPIFFGRNRPGTQQLAATAVLMGTSSR